MRLMDCIVHLLVPIVRVLFFGLLKDNKTPTESVTVINILDHINRPETSVPL